MGEHSSLPTGEFLSVEQAREFYNLEQRPLSLFSSDLEKQLHEKGIARVAMPISASDFQQLCSLYEACLDDCPEILATTFHSVDDRFGNDAGQVRKEQKFDANGNQTDDPKNYFHFNEQARELWTPQFTQGPRSLRSFLDAGYEIHNDMVLVARQQFAQLEDTHPNISKAYFPESSDADSSFISHSYMRVACYDPYEHVEGMGEVAKPHRDIGGGTLHGFDDAPGFWICKEGSHGGEKTYYRTGDGYGYMFLGNGHDKLYGNENGTDSLWHGVDRIVPEGTKFVIARNVVVMFIDAPYIDYGTTPQDTLPHLAAATQFEQTKISAA